MSPLDLPLDFVCAATIPMSVIKNMGLKIGDKISWNYEIRNGEIVPTIRKVKISSKR
jgi:antitoxin component of MazEF toxin-antitoxin module